MNKDNYKEKTMNKYSNGKIYQIESNVGNKIYIGSTVKKLLCDRMSGHRYDYKRWKDGNKQRIYKSFEMFDEYGLENCKIVLIENYPCNNKKMNSTREKDISRRPWLVLTRSKIRELLMKLANKNVRKNTVKKTIPPPQQGEKAGI
jgi:hypothetical protein